MHFGGRAGVIAGVFLSAVPAFAQEYGELPAWVVEARLAAIAGAAVAGFLLGVLFSPLGRHFRLLLLILSAVALSVYILTSPSPLATLASFFASFYIFLVAFAFGISLGYTAWRAARQTPCRRGHRRPCPMSGAAARSACIFSRKVFVLRFDGLRGWRRETPSSSPFRSWSIFWSCPSFLGSLPGAA
jgi:hypothetical protein